MQAIWNIWKISAHLHEKKKHIKYSNMLHEMNIIKRPIT